MPDVRGRLTTLAYRAGATAAQLVPASIATPIARAIGRAAAPILPAQRRMAARHQRRATGNETVKGVFDSYGRYWLEMLRLPAEVRSGSVVSHCTIDGFEHIEAALARGNGVILALPHLGGWEWAGAAMALRGHRLLAVVEKIEPPELLAWFAAQRAAIGIDVVTLGPEVGVVVLRALRDNRIVCLLSDRDIAGDGVEVEFFGERTTLPGGPATLALRTGAALLPAAVYFRGGRDHLGVVRPPVEVQRLGRLREDIARITQVLANELETLIRAAPEQWHLLQPNWPSDRARSRDE
ncbi:MAG: phosphatidylinositol dimannoside acyltransferase [Actinomycetota bacterium]|nr:phosphatidylinositol dimannoside acyltransferase [Actinomycetota bacterium]